MGWFEDELGTGVVPLEVEIEFTNRCNAGCIACPRGRMPDQGAMSAATLDHILAVARQIEGARAEAVASMPLRLTIAGAGEPFLHKNALDLFARAVEAFPWTRVITNAGALAAPRADELVRLRPASITCSFWGIQPDEYEAAMNLPYHRTLARVEYLADRAIGAGIPFEVSWVRNPAIRTSDQDIQAFWAQRGIPVAMEGGAMWNRGGLLTATDGFVAAPDCRPPDPRRFIWCAAITYSLCFNWKGDCLPCCCAYFDRDGLVLGSAHRNDWGVLAERKRRFVLGRPLPTSCTACLMPQRAHAKWLAGAILDKLSPIDLSAAIYP